MSASTSSGLSKGAASSGDPTLSTMSTGHAPTTSTPASAHAPNRDNRAPNPGVSNVSDAPPSKVLTSTTAPPTVPNSAPVHAENAPASPPASRDQLLEDEHTSMHGGELMTPLPNPDDYITIVSAQGYEFLIEKEVACVSKAIQTLLAVPGLCENNRVIFEEIPPTAMELVCLYMCERNNKCSSISEFRPLKALDANNERDVQVIMELLLAADYLDC